MGFTMEMHGAYLIMLIFQFNQGKFTENSAVALVGEHWKQIKHKFESRDGVCWNQRLMDETEKRKEHCAHQRENIMKRWGKNDNPLSNKKISVIPSNEFGITTVIPLEDEDRNGIGIVLNTTKDSNKDVSGIVDMFELFWKEYPKKVGKGAAEKSWKKISSIKSTFEKIITALEWQKKSDQWCKEGGQYIPNPATYLTQKRWMDEKKDGINWDNVFNIEVKP